MNKSEFAIALNHASYEGLNKILEEKCEVEDKCVFAAGALWARDWILDQAMRNARESITDQEYLFIDDLKILLSLKGAK